MKFSNNFGPSDHLHELTGEPYLAVSMRTHWRPPHRGWKGRIFYKTYYSPDAGVYSRPRRVVNAPGHALRTLRRKMAPWLCRHGIHEPMDIIEIDASVWRAGCLYCKQLCKPYGPQPPNAEEAAQYQAFNLEGEAISKSFDDYEAGTGPCPLCNFPIGRHDEKCWLAP